MPIGRDGPLLWGDAPHRDTARHSEQTFRRKRLCTQPVSPEHRQTTTRRTTRRKDVSAETSARAQAGGRRQAESRPPARRSGAQEVGRRDGPVAHRCIAFNRSGRVHRSAGCSTRKAISAVQISAMPACSHHSLAGGAAPLLPGNRAADDSGLLAGSGWVWPCPCLGFGVSAS